MYGTLLQFCTTGVVRKLKGEQVHSYTIESTSSRDAVVRRGRCRSCLTLLKRQTVSSRQMTDAGPSSASGLGQDSSASNGVLQAKLARRKLQVVHRPQRGGISHNAFLFVHSAACLRRIWSSSAAPSCLAQPPRCASAHRRLLAPFSPPVSLRLLTQHDVELLSNRVERLREEERKAKQKVLETRLRGQEIAALQKRNEQANTARRWPSAWRRTSATARCRCCA